MGFFSSEPRALLPADTRTCSTLSMQDSVRWYTQGGTVGRLYTRVYTTRVHREEYTRHIPLRVYPGCTSLTRAIPRVYISHPCYTRGVHSRHASHTRSVHSRHASHTRWYSSSRSPNPGGIALPALITRVVYTQWCTYPGGVYPVVHIPGLYLRLWEKQPGVYHPFHCPAHRS